MVRPEVAEKCLRLTGAFEGHGSGIAAGDFDGAALTWGPLGFNLASGGLHAVLLRIVQLQPAAVHPALADAIRLGKTATISFVRDFVHNPQDRTRLRPEWQRRFIALYQAPAAQQAFREGAYRYLRRAEAIAAAFGFRTERGFSLAFDIAVQNGSVRPAARPLWASTRLRFAAQSDHDDSQEWVRLKALAYAVAEVSLPRWRRDVLSRKLTCAVGAGQVHGRFYDLARDFKIQYSDPWAETA